MKVENFIPSVNVKYDYEHMRFLENFIPIGQQIDLIEKSLLNLSQTGKKAQIVYGPYGSGKSLVLSIIANLTGKVTSNTKTKIMRNKKIEAAYTNFDNKNMKYIPIILNGSSENIESHILQEIIVALQKEKNISDLILPGDVEKIYSIVEKWKMEYILTYKIMNEQIELYNESLDSFFEKVKNGDEKVIQFFKKIYTELTSGAEFPISYNADNFFQIIEVILLYLKTNQLGIYLIFDEFGRQLEVGRNNSEFLSKTMQFLQDLSEFANNRVGNLSIIIATHLEWQQYFFNDMNIQQEFSKIEKRFIRYKLWMDEESALEILAKTINSQKEELSEMNDDILYDNELFQTALSDKKIKEFISLCFPLSAMSVFCLLKLSEKLGQNERTLFTFLLDESENGFKTHLDLYRDEYFLFDKVLAYFIDEIALNSKEYPNYKKYVKAIKKINENKEQKIILSAIFTLDIIDSSLPQSMEVFSNMTNLSIKSIESSITELEKMRIIRFNSAGRIWQFKEKVNFDLKKAFLDQSSPSLEVLEQVLIEELEEKWIYPESYNYEYEMTRFAELFVSIIPEGESYKKKQRNESDFSVHYCICAKGNQNTIIDQVIENGIDSDTIIKIVEVDLDILESYLTKMFNLKSIEKDSTTLLQYKGLKEEILFQTLENRIKNKALIKKIKSHQNQLIYFDSEIKMSSNKDVVEILDDIAIKMYDSTPIIGVDLINRRNVSKVQYNALVKIGQKMISESLIKSNIAEISFDGNGPESLSYFSMFKKQGLELTTDLASEGPEIFRSMYSDVIGYLKQYRIGSLISLYDILMKPPYGIRRPLVPVYLIYFLLKSIPDMFFYSNGNYLPNITSETFFESLYNSDEIDIKYEISWSEDIEERTVTYFYEKISKYISDNVKSKNLIVQIASGYLNWKNTLPPIVEQTFLLSKEQKEFLVEIGKSQSDPIGFLKYLEKTLSKDNEIENLMESLNNFIDNITQYYGDNLFNKYKVDSLIHDDVGDSNIFQLIQRNRSDFFKIFSEEKQRISSKEWTQTTVDLIEKRIGEELDELTGRFRTDTLINKEKYISFENRKIKVDEIELSRSAKSVYSNLEATLNNSRITEKEKKKIIYELLCNVLE